MGRLGVGVGRGRNVRDDLIQVLMAGKSRALMEQSLDCLLVLSCSFRMALSLFILNAQDSKLHQQGAPEAAIW